MRADLAPVLAAALLLVGRAPAFAADVTWAIAGQPLAIRADPAFAGAISSIRFRGREYLDASDHGRELQGAVQFGQGECLNPTLAGSSEDGPGQDGLGHSTSVLLQQRVGPKLYASATRMAFWHAPGRRCRGETGQPGRAQNTDAVSDLVYRQTLTPGFRGHANAVLDQVVITAAKAHPPASVEALTAYMPPDFRVFLAYVAADQRFERDRWLPLTSGERDGPLILSTDDGSAAMGVVALAGEGVASYAGFHSAGVSKWSVVFRSGRPFGAGAHAYRCVWAVGTRREVVATLSAILGAEAAQAYGPVMAVLLLAGAAVAAGVLLVRRLRPPRGLRPLR